MKKQSILRLVTGLVLLAMLLAAAVSCASGNTETQTTGAEVVGTTPSGEDISFPDADYGGEDFPIYFRRQKTDHYRGVYIVPEEDSADVIDQQAEIRNIRVEEKYHIKFTGIEVDTPTDTLKTDIASGDTPYYLILDMRKKLGPQARAGLLTNFNDLDVDYTAEWWDANAVKQYDVDGRLYCMPNDVSVSNLAGAGFLCFNKAVLEDYQLTSPYDYAAKDQWTINTFYTMVKSVSNEGADGEFGVYGFLDSDKNTVYHMLVGVGVPRVERNSEGTLVCTIGTEYAERTQSFLESYKTLVENKKYVQNYADVDNKDSKGASSYTDYYTHARGMFKEDHFLFVMSDMDICDREFKDMTKGFGVIMNPKYDADQEEYYHFMDNNSLIWSIPYDPGLNLEEIGNVMDYWAYCSKSTVMESFYELTLKSKRASDPVTASMLDTIKSSICYFTTDLYKVELIDTMLDESYDGSLANAWKKYQTPIGRNLEKIISDLETYND